MEESRDKKSLPQCPRFPSLICNSIPVLFGFGPSLIDSPTFYQQILMPVSTPRRGSRRVRIASAARFSRYGASHDVALQLLQRHRIKCTYLQGIFDMRSDETGRAVLELH